jgi:hypothetical protein
MKRQKNYYYIKKIQEIENKTSGRQPKGDMHVFFDNKTGWQVRPIGKALGDVIGVEWL